MKSVLGLMLVAALGVTATGCGYGGAAASGDKVVVLRNDGFLFGALRNAYVCKIPDGGLTSCQSAESP